MPQGAWRDAFPWLVSLPLFLALLPSIIVAGYPDLETDRLAGKRTLAARLGHRGTLLVAMAPALAAPVLTLATKDWPALRGSLDGLIPWAVPMRCCCAHCSGGHTTGLAAGSTCCCSRR